MIYFPFEFFNNYLFIKSSKVCAFEFLSPSHQSHGIKIMVVLKKLYNIVFIIIPLSEPLLAFLRFRRVLQNNTIMMSDLKLYYSVLVRRETVCPTTRRRFSGLF